MTRYIEFELIDGGTVIIEAEGEPTEGLVSASSPGEMVEKAKDTFDEAIEHVRGAAGVIVRKLRSLTDPPDEMEVTFGLKASGELGNIVVGKGGVEANYTVTMKWSRREAKKSDKA
jgi:hypothetical protein